MTETIDEDNEKIVARFNKRISDITGLDLETAELLQMGNYGVGGQECFMDFYSEPTTFKVTGPKLGGPRVMGWTGDFIYGPNPVVM